MTNPDMIRLEEVLLGLLRSSKLIVLKDCKIEDRQDKDIFTLSLEVDKNFGSTLIYGLNNKFFEFFDNKSAKTK